MYKLLPHLRNNPFHKFSVLKSVHFISHTIDYLYVRWVVSFALYTLVNYTPSISWHLSDEILCVLFINTQNQKVTLPPVASLYDLNWDIIGNTATVSGWLQVYLSWRFHTNRTHATQKNGRTFVKSYVNPYWRFTRLLVCFTSFILCSIPCCFSERWLIIVSYRCQHARSCNINAIVVACFTIKLLVL